MFFQLPVLQSYVGLMDQHQVLGSEARRDFLERFFELPNGLPSQDVFRRVLCALQPVALQQCVNLWIQSMSAAVELPIATIESGACEV